MSTFAERLKNAMVWAESVEEATHKITSAIGGVYGEYSWTGSGPEYEHNEVVQREKKEA